MSRKEAGIIRKLDEVVVNRIAAGEVIQRPANALKELLENSLDAGAKNIQVVVKSGGLKLLQIQDDGSGIRKEDLSIVCERFTTSKLQAFEDLQQIGTYGFRGEALASISHVAHLSIVTKTSDSQCAFRAEYTNGKLTEKEGNPKPCAGNQGTTIIVEDLFFNMDTRRKALRTTSEEHAKILDVVTRYAVHNSAVGFGLKKHGEVNNEIRTSPNSSALDNIKALYGIQIARELLPVNFEGSFCQFKMNGYVSNANYSIKKPSFLLFINNRLVDSSALRKIIDGIYAAYLPKGSHPFVYLGLQIEPKNVDVNVHPTKHEVHFLHEDMILSAIGNEIDKSLQGSNQSRTFYVQSLLPGASAVTSSDISKKRKEQSMEDSVASTSSSKKIGVTYAKDMVRTDPREQKLDKFVTSLPKSSTPQSLINNSSEDAMEVDQDSRHVNQQAKTSPLKREIKLKSVKVLQEKVKHDCHMGLLSAFRNHTFVGCVDRTLALVQHETKLYMVNTTKLSCELFYQKLIYQFGNFGCLNIEDPISVYDLVLTAMKIDKKFDPTLGTKEDVAIEVSNFLKAKSPMLNDYFSLKIDEDGKLLSIPLLLENYVPCMDGVPSYLWNLVKRVNWESEQECFQTFCHETALFYAVQPGDDKENEEISCNECSWKWTIEHIIYPELKKSLIPPKKFAEDASVIQLADLPNLYKVFERC